MTTHHPTSSHLVPTSSPAPGTTSESTSSPRPLPYGDEVELESTDHHHKTTTSSPTTRDDLTPPNGTIYVVRWIRADGRDTKHKYFRRSHDAQTFHDRLHAGGWTVATFTSDTKWSSR